MSLQLTDGYDPSGDAREVVDDVYALSQRKAGRIHAHLLDDAGAITLVDALYHSAALPLALRIRPTMVSGERLAYARRPQRTVPFAPPPIDLPE